MGITTHLEKMTDWFKLIHEMLWGKPPLFSGAVKDRFEDLPHEGLTMGTLYIGRQGTGKTFSLARYTLEYFMQYPDRAIFVLDWSGSISDSILKLILRQPKDIREKLLRRVVYDELGNPEWVVPMPEFSQDYDPELSWQTRVEVQVARVTQNLERLHKNLIERNPTMGGQPIRDFFPNVARLLCAIRNETGESWQITEAKRFLRGYAKNKIEGELKNAVTNYGNFVPHSRDYFLHDFAPSTFSDKEKTTKAIKNILTVCEPWPIRARLGYPQPGWTPREAIESGLLVLVDGSKLIDQDNVRDYLFTQAFSLIMSEINKRRPDDPDDLPVTLLLDEVYSLIQISGMGAAISRLAPQYRNRKLQLLIALQELAQMSEDLRAHIWSLGNIVCFGLSNHNEAYEMAQQLFKYEAGSIKLPSSDKSTRPIIEADRGQYLAIANKIQRMERRECIVRRYLSEEEMDRYIRYVPKTKEVQQAIQDESVEEVRERLVKERGVRVEDALHAVNKRKMDISGKTSESLPKRHGY